jgi:hypothetical protein
MHIEDQDIRPAIARGGILLASNRTAHAKHVRSEVLAIVD